MYFPVADITASPILIVGVAFVVAFFCSAGGISGAFLLLPWQVSFLGYTAPGVSATNQIFNIVACPGGVWRYAREGRLLIPLTLIMVCGTMPGVFAGALIRLRYLNNLKSFMLFASALLFYLGARLILSLRQAEAQTPGRVKVAELSLRRLKFVFGNMNYEVPVPALFILSLLVGLVGGVYGVGGGAIMTPFLIAFFKLPVRAVAGASLFSTFITSIAGAVFYNLLAWRMGEPAGAPDWGLGALMGVGGLIGMYLGARCQKFIPTKIIKLGLALVVLGLACSWLYKGLA